MDDEVTRTLGLLNESFPPVHSMDAADARAAIAARRQPVGNLADVRSSENCSVPLGDGGATLGVRVYRPHGPSDVRRPLVVFLHGGGFVFCDLETHDGFCRAMSKHLDAVVVSVDYRLAPEHRAPTAAEDAYAALCWAVEQQALLGIDPARVVMAGDSAGGNLAAVTCLLARDRGGPPIAGQALLYPVVDPACDTDSFRTHGEGFYNTRAAMEWYWAQYLGPDGLPEPQHHAAPARAASLAQLPPAVVAVAGADPLRAEGEAYAAALAAAGVPVVLRTYPGLFHGFMTMLSLRAGESARTLLWSDLRAALDHTAKAVA